jgi:hypothetical protein
MSLMRFGDVVGNDVGNDVVDKDMVGDYVIVGTEVGDGEGEAKGDAVVERVGVVANAAVVELRVTGVVVGEDIGDVGDDVVGM